MAGAPVVPTETIDPQQLSQRIVALESFIAGLGPFLAGLNEMVVGKAPGKGPGGGGGGGGKGKGGAFVGLATPGTALNHCEWVAVWTNGTGAAKDRSVDLQPNDPPNGFPPGSKITVFTGPVPPPAPPPGQASPPVPACPAGVGAPPGTWPTAPPGAGLNVPAGQAMYVHYDKGNSGVGGIKVNVSTTPA